VLSLDDKAELEPTSVPESPPRGGGDTPANNSESISPKSNSEDIAKTHSTTTREKDVKTTEKAKKKGIYIMSEEL